MSMSNDQAAPPQSIIRRTLTITTTETWIITFGPAPETADRPSDRGAPPDIIDQPIDSLSQAHKGSSHETSV